MCCVVVQSCFNFYLLQSNQQDVCVWILHTFLINAVYMTSEKGFVLFFIIKCLFFFVLGSDMYKYYKLYFPVKCKEMTL